MLVSSSIIVRFAANHFHTTAICSIIWKFTLENVLIKANFFSNHFNKTAIWQYTQARMLLITFTYELFAKSFDNLHPRVTTAVFVVGSHLDWSRVYQVTGKFTTKDDQWNDDILKSYLDMNLLLNIIYIYFIVTDSVLWWFMFWNHFCYNISRLFSWYKDIDFQGLSWHTSCTNIFLF